MEILFAQLIVSLAATDLFNSQIRSPNLGNGQ